MKKIAISQSNYIPWKGYFDLINSVDEFIFYDDMQFTKRDWRNRNQIKTSNGLLWLTVPVKVKGKFHQKINETEIEGRDWAPKHWKSIQTFYGRSPHFCKFAAEIEELYLKAEGIELLSDLNSLFIKKLCDLMGIRTTLRNSSEFALKEGKTERLVDLCQQNGANLYLSGPAARDYIVPELFEEAGIELRWMDYQGYPSYEQRFGDFRHEVSILDLIFNTGDDFRNYMKTFTETRKHD